MPDDRPDFPTDDSDEATHPEPTPESMERCPVCGMPGRIVGSDEGTQHFEAATPQADRGDGLREEDVTSARDDIERIRQLIEHYGGDSPSLPHAIAREFAALRDTAPSGLDVKTLARAIESLAHGHCCWDAVEDSRDLAAEYARLRDEGASGTPAAEG